MIPEGLLDRRVASAFFGGFSELRPIQKETIPAVLSGGHVLLASGTGSGKTEAVVAPLVSRYWREALTQDATRILYIAPTKALVNDLDKRLTPPLSRLGLVTGIRHGDRDDLAAGRRPHLLFTTPESLEVMLCRRDSRLAGVRAIVVDEVHLLYNTQRGLQLAVLIERLRKGTVPELQVCALSATVAALENVRTFLLGYKAAGVVVRSSVERRIDAHIRAFGSTEDFGDYLARVVADNPTKLLVFVNARRECEAICAALSAHAVTRGSVFAHYSSLSPDVRRRTEALFAARRSAVCVATGTLELGIDIGDIDAVALWGVPGGVESFLQRIGRSNRRSNVTNVVCGIPRSVSPQWECLRFAALLNAARSGRLPDNQPYRLFGSLAQQAIAQIWSAGGAFTKVSDLFSTVSHLGIEAADFVTILDALCDVGVLQKHGFKNRYGATDVLHRLADLDLIYGNFATTSMEVEVRHGRQLLGSVQASNLLRIRPGGVVKFAGRCWKVKKANREGFILEPHAKPQQPMTSHTPAERRVRTPERVIESGACCTSHPRPSPTSMTRCAARSNTSVPSFAVSPRQPSSPSAGPTTGIGITPSQAVS